jgi:hypothetical protein
MNKGKKSATPVCTGNCANPELCEHLSHNDVLCHKCSNYRKKMRKSAGALDSN